jgi:IS5 family transposase
MKMQLFETLRLKFEQPNWALNPEFGLLDTILEQNPSLLKIVSSDILAGTKQSDFGRQDMPSVEQIVRAAIYKEMKKLDYRELEYAQDDSKICQQFVKIDNRKPFSFQVLQKYISKITEHSLQLLLVSLNKIAIGEGLEDLSKLRQDSIVVETNIHYPTNNALVWDCIKESHRLLTHLKKEMQDLNYRDYTTSAKKTYFKINVTKSKDKRVDLFNTQLITFTKCINQVANAIKKKGTCSLKASIFIIALEELQPLLAKVYNMTWRKEINTESVPNDEKLFSIYELHTNIIVKGAREVQFGHKVNFSTGKSNLILTCDILKGNPSDSTLFQPTIDKVVEKYGVTPRDSATDGGYASKANAGYAEKKGIKNIVFNKIVGSLKNIVSSKNIETRLKKWRSGIEAVISNFKRGYNMFRCNWKGEAHFNQKVLWSTIAYNIRVMTAAIVAKL